MVCGSKTSTELRRLVPSNSWIYKHGLEWPKPHDACYTGPPAGQQRIAIVCGCTRPEHWYAVDPPHRIVLDGAGKALKN